jgi:DNA-binding transcriptional regulator YiaG
MACKVQCQLTGYPVPCKMILLKEIKNRSVWNGQHIKALRKHLGLTQSSMACQLGTRQQTISEWEVGIYQPRGTSITLLDIVAERSGFTYKSNENNRSRI